MLPQTVQQRETLSGEAGPPERRGWYAPSSDCTVFRGNYWLEDAARLFSRWSQENFFRYMMEHFAIDLLNEYRTEEIPETKRPVVNPQWRELDRQKRSVKSKLTHRQARFAALTLHPQSEEAAQAKWEKRKD